MRISVAVLLFVFAAGAQQKKAPEPRYKAIWEPVNFNKDIDLNAIACVSAKECWTVGNKSTILHTASGGDQWEAQLGGDPAATDEDLVNVFALDARHIWALGERSKLLRSVDGGATWSEAGKLPATAKDIEFVSPSTGFSAENSSSITQSTLIRTDDGGRTWKPVLKCMVSATVGGLAREVSCRIRSLQFVDSQTGYGVGHAALGVGMGVPQQGVLLRTTDGGNSWEVAAPPEFDQEADSLRFWPGGHGLVVLFNGRALATSDGGKTWTGAITPLKTPCYYASAGGGFVVGIHRYSKQIAYSSNGGKTFSGRPFPPPAEVHALEFPDARHGYFAGRHGMIFRYVVVPAAYKKAGMLDAAMPPA